MNSSLLGSILMILGTSIGAAMVALPVATAPYPLTISTLTLIGCWLLSTFGAMALAELSLKMPDGSNLISMSKLYFGKIGGAFSWFLYLSLMASLTCAYLSGIGEIIGAILASIGVKLENSIATGIAVLLLFLILSRGLKTVDCCNRLLMTIKGLVYFALVYAVVPHMEAKQLFNEVNGGSIIPQSNMISMIFTSFGYSVIIPSITSYLDRDRKQIYKAIFIGSALPLIIYLLWILIIQGLLPRFGENSLMQIMAAENTNGELITALKAHIEANWISTAIQTFITVAILTSFLGVAYSLSDFLADGLKINKSGKFGWIVYVLTLLPAYLVILQAPDIFTIALEHAGVICLLLLVVWPVLILLYSNTNHAIKKCSIDSRDGRI